MLERDLAYALDPVLWAREKLRLVLDPVQADLLARRGHRELLNCARQWGKSTVIAAGVLHECSYRLGSCVVVMSPTARQSGLLLAKIAAFAERAGIESSPLAGEDPGLRFPCGDVVALPGKEATTRGFAGVTWLVIDEAAQVANGLYHSARAYLATTNGRVSLLSTPFGRRGFFYDEHEAGRYRVTRVAAQDCPRISAEFLAEQRVSMPDWFFRQEFCCEFTATDDAIFNHDLVLASISDEVMPLCL